MESHHIECFGVIIELTGPADVPELLSDHLPALLPSSARTSVGDLSYEIRERHGEERLLGYEVWRTDDTLLTRSRDLEGIVRDLANHLHFEIASRASDYVFVHAGVVGWHDHAIVLPGRSMSGKTTLVTELLKQGATYYSDEYAVVDTAGMVHPYARQLRVRAADRTAENRDPRDFTSLIGTDPIPIGMIAVLRYEHGASLDLEPLSPAAAALALIDNTVRVRDEPAPSVRAASTAGEALSLQGVRGESTEAAARLLERAAENFSRR